MILFPGSCVGGTIWHVWLTPHTIDTKLHMEHRKGTLTSTVCFRCLCLTMVTRSPCWEESSYQHWKTWHFFFANFRVTGSMIALPTNNDNNNCFPKVKRFTLHTCNKQILKKYFTKNYICSKHSETIAGAIHVPYRFVLFYESFEAYNYLRTNINDMLYLNKW